MKIKVVVNPKSKIRNRNYLEAMLKEKFSHSLIDVECTAYPQHASDISRQAVKQNVDTIVVVGGDGTVNEVLSGIVGTDVALGIIPTGTANDLATLYHMPSDICKACNVILERHLHRFDVICVNGWYYATGGGIGMPCEIAKIANKIKRHKTVGKLFTKILGSKVYILAVLCSLLKKSNRHNFLKIRGNGCSFTTDAFSLMVDNQPFLGKHFWLSPGALNDDGIFDICLIENPKNHMQIFSIMIKILGGKHINLPSVKIWRAKELVVNTKNPLSFYGDGEILVKESEFKINILPKALNVIVPKSF